MTQLCPRVCNSVFVSAHGLKCLLGVFITLSDLRHDSHFMSHVAQIREGRVGWQSARTLVSVGEEGGIEQADAISSTTFLYLPAWNRAGKGLKNKRVPLADKHTVV